MASPPLRRNRPPARLHCPSRWPRLSQSQMAPASRKASAKIFFNVGEPRIEVPSPLLPARYTGPTPPRSQLARHLAAPSPTLRTRFDPRSSQISSKTAPARPLFRLPTPRAPRARQKLSFFQIHEFPKPISAGENFEPSIGLLAPTCYPPQSRRSPASIRATSSRNHSRRVNINNFASFTNGPKNAQPIFPRQPNLNTKSNPYTVCAEYPTPRPHFPVRHRKYSGFAIFASV